MRARDIGGIALVAASACAPEARSLQATEVPSVTLEATRTVAMPGLGELRPTEIEAPSLDPAVPAPSVAPATLRDTRPPIPTEPAFVVQLRPRKQTKHATCCCGPGDLQCALMCMYERPPIDRGAVKAMVEDVWQRARSCPAHEGDRTAKIAVTFLSSGQLRDVDLGALKGTASGRCIAQAFEGKSVSSFEGPATIATTLVLAAGPSSE